MAGKNTKLAGERQQWDLAAKQFEWPIDHEDKQILVPESDLEAAMSNSMVLYFRANGWHIQSVIGTVEKKVVWQPPFTPGAIFAGKANLPKEVKQTKSLYNIGDKFKINSTECEVEITIIIPKLHLKYTNRNKPDIISSEDQLTKVLNRGVWKRI